MSETTKAGPTAEQITVATIRQWAEGALLAESVADEGHTTPTAYHARGYEHAARHVLDILAMNGAPPNEPVVYGATEDKMRVSKGLPPRYAGTVGPRP